MRATDKRPPVVEVVVVTRKVADARRRDRLGRLLAALLWPPSVKR